MKLGNQIDKYVNVITHSGRVIAFSSRETEDGSGRYRIGYTILDLTPENPNQDAAWKDFDFLPFPREIRPVARDVITIDFKDQDIPVADVPFEVVSDSRFVYVFRQSTNNTLYVDRFVYDAAKDRLTNAWEVRFRRSRKIDIPLDRRDTFGSTDMNGRRFIAPTIDIDCVNNLTEGRFAAVIVPTELAGVDRWQIFAQDSTTDRLNSYSILRGPDGLFDFSDVIDEESDTIEPNRRFKLKLASGDPLSLQSGIGAVLYSQQEWLEDEYGRLSLQKREARVMVAVAAGPDSSVVIADFGVGKDGFLAQVPNNLTVATATAIGTALMFVRQQRTTVDVAAALPGGAGLTIEAWIYPREFTSGDDLVMQSAPSEPNPFALALRGGVPVFSSPGGSAVEGGQSLGIRGWTHLAGVWDGKKAVLYVNGQRWADKSDPVSNSGAPTSGYRFGGSEGFTGMLDEVRLWKTARTRAQILSTMCTGVSSSTPGWDDLVGYWKMDEPDDNSRFTTVPNASKLGAAGNGVLSGARWVATSAPVGVSMGPQAWDENGLTVATALLPFAATGVAPRLFEGPDSLIHLYYSAKADLAIMSAHFSVIVARATYLVPWTAPDLTDPDNEEEGVVSFIARQSGTSMNNPVVSPEFVTIETGPTDPEEHATVTLRSSTGYAEVWPKVPLSLADFMDILNGDAAQKSTDPVEIANGVLMYDYAEVVVTPAGGQLGPHPRPGTGSSIFRVLPDAMPDNGQTAYVEMTEGAAAARGRAGTDPWWQASPPLSDMNWSEIGQYVRILSQTTIAEYRGPLVLDRDLAVEAWLKPASNPMGEDAVLFLFNKPDGAQYLVGLDSKGRPFAADGDVAAVADAVIGADGTWAHMAASYRTDYGLQLGGARYLDAGNDASLGNAEAITIEGWVRIDRLGTRQTVAAKWDPARGQSWELGLNEQGNVRFTVNQSTATGPILRTATSAGKLQEGRWHHVAGVYDVAFDRQVAIMFDIGSFVKIPPPASPPTDGITVAMWIKRAGTHTTDDEILFMSTDPQSPLPTTLLLQKGIPSFKVTAGGQTHSVGGSLALRNDDWIHLAGSYSSKYGIMLVVDGVPVSKAPSTEAAELSRDWPGGERVQVEGALEAYYTVGGLASQKTFIGAMNELSVWNRGLSLDEIRQKIRHPLATTERGLVGYWRFNDLYGTTVMDLAGTANGELVKGNFVRLDKGAFAHKVFIDGTMEAFDRVVDPVVLSDAAVTMGARYYDQYLQGAIAETRLWKVGRMNWQILYFANLPLEPNAEGLIALWPFDTGRGRVAFDAKGNINAVIRDGVIDLTDEAVDKMWIRTTFKAAWSFYVNGDLVGSTPLTLASPGFADPQATIGALKYDGASARFFTGEINELRVWSAQRTGVQVRALMNRRLSGAEATLAAYWPMDDGSGKVIGDRTGYGADGVWIGSEDLPTWQLSTAPVGIEAPQIRSTPGGIAIPENRRSSWAPGVASYGQLEISARGDLAATLRLAYALIDAVDSRLELISGFGVGDLELQYIGQAQLAPTLIGYIEGPPPLPAENLKLYPGEPDSYVGATTLTLEETGSRVFSYTASRNVGSDSTASLSLGLNIGTATSAGIGVEQEVFSFFSTIGLSTEVEQTLGDLDEALVSEETTIGAKKYVEVRGLWHENSYQIDNGVGQIFYPSNVGYALVRSGTADTFAMRLRGTGTIVGYVMRPNPDIPEDINILMFKMKSTYVKNGTLDGWIGFEPDVSYSFLTPGERGSYFKPLQAYAMKQLIERERQQRKTWFDNFDATALGRREKVGRPGSIDIAESDRSLANALMGVSAKGALTSEEWKARMGRRNMVNTYVWTAEGGLYSEEEQFVAIREESSGGTYSMTAKAGVFLEIGFNIGPSFSLDAMFGSHIITQAMKNDHEAWQFSLNVDVLGERYIGLLKEDDEGEIVYTDTPAPGKVKAYRFMTFYLAPSKKNFDDFEQVVDEDWLNGQGAYAGHYDPDALALRQALTNVNEVWRVLHRVTYVSRVPPLSQDQGESLAENVREPDEESIIGNLLLIQALPTDRQAPNPMAKVSLEADTLLANLAQNPVWGKLIQDGWVEFKKDIMIYMKSYYAIP
jgi:hypothetical protein